MAEGIQRPRSVVISGPNGAGKTTTATTVMPDDIPIRHFVNADAIAAGLSAFDPEAVAFQAGRIMPARIEELVQARQSFAFETTLASRAGTPVPIGRNGQIFLLYPDGTEKPLDEPAALDSGS